MKQRSDPSLVVASLFSRAFWSDADHAEGRLLDHMENTSAFQYEQCQWLVLDEADILLHLGFENFIRSIVRHLNWRKNVEHRQNVLVSATLDARVSKLAQFVLSEPAFVSVDESMSSVDGGPGSGHHITFAPALLGHHFVECRRAKQPICLVAFLRYLYYENLHKLRTFKCIVFMSTCQMVHFYFTLFRDGSLWQDSSESVLPRQHGVNGEDIPWFELYGDMTSKERTAVFFQFSSSSNGVLLCTDVASRGLDIPSVRFIVQYDPPSKINDYIHRSGRTARMGRSGQTFLFLTPPEMGFIDILKKHNFRFSQVAIGRVWGRLNVDYKRHLQRTQSQRHRSSSTPKKGRKRKRKRMEHNLGDDAFDTPYGAMLAMGRHPHSAMMDEAEGSDPEEEPLGEERAMRRIMENPADWNSRDAMAMHFTRRVMEDEILQNMARTAMRSFISAYGTYPAALKTVFFVKNLDFNQLADCFFVERDRKIKRKENRSSFQKDRAFKRSRRMQDRAQKLTKKRNRPQTMSEFAS